MNYFVLGIGIAYAVASFTEALGRKWGWTCIYMCYSISSIVMAILAAKGSK